MLAARKPFPAFADETIELHDLISVSAGQRGLQLLLAPADYLRATACSSPTSPRLRPLRQTGA